MSEYLAQIADATIPKPLGRMTDVVPDRYTPEQVLDWVLKAYQKGQGQLRVFAPYLRKDNVDATLRNVWSFVHNNIKFRRDGQKGQYPQTPAAAWAARRGDCKSYSVWIKSALDELGIPSAFRFVSHQTGIRKGIPGFHHVYVVVQSENGHEVVLDANQPVFNRELPYIKKKMLCQA